MKNSAFRSVLIRALFLFAIVPLSASWATNYTWTNTANGASGSWTNGVLWGNAASGYPGNAADTPSAFLTNNAGIAGGSYTNVLDFNLNRLITSLVVSNGNSGQAWLIVTNGSSSSTVLTNSTLVLGSGGRLQIDSGGVVTGTTAFTWSGTNGTIVLNNGGKLFTTAATVVPGASSTGFVTSVSSSGGTWDLGGQTLALNSGAALTINGATLTVGTTASSIDIGSVAGTGSALTISNGVQMINQGNVRVGLASGTNTVNIGGLGAASLSTNRGFAIGANFAGAAGKSFNTLNVSNAIFQTGSPGQNDAIGVSSTNNTVNILANGTWSHFVNAINIGAGTSLAPATGNVLNINSGVVTNLGNANIGSGGGGVGNGMNVMDGGTYISPAGGITVGNSAGDSNNYLNVGSVGISSLSSNGGQITVGNTGAGNNTMTLTNAVLFSGQFVVGSGSSNNTFDVRAGGTWNARNSDVYVGSGVATGNVLTINNGTLTNGSRLFVGGTTAGAVGNTMTVSNGTQVSLNSSVYVGRIGGSTSNTLNIGGLGAASTWTNNGEVVVGAGVTMTVGGSSFNTLTVSNATAVMGSVVQNNGIGFSSTNNTINVLSNATLLVNVGALTIGTGTSASPGTGNVLNVNGGTFKELTVAVNIGVGAGGAGIGNGVTVANGGQFITGAAGVTVGVNDGDSNNYYNVGGVGAASFASNGVITVGSTAAGFNRLTVTNALLVSTGATIGSGSSNNTARVQAGGTWNLLGNTLTVGTGAALSNSVFVQGGQLKSTTLNNNSSASLLDIIGGGGIVTNGTYTQGASSTLGYEFTSASTVSAGIGVLNVGGTATRAGTLAVGLHGGIGSFLTTNTATLLTSGATSGSFTVTNRGVFALSGTATEIDALLDLTQKRLPTPLTLGTPQTLSSPGFNTGWFEVSTNYLAGFPSYGIDLTITNAGATASVDALAAYLATSGETVTYTTNAANVYDLRLNPFATSTVASNAYFAWDFSPLDSNFLVTGAALFVPEPSTLLLGCGGAATIVWLRRRRAKK